MRTWKKATLKYAGWFAVYLVAMYWINGLIVAKKLTPYVP